MGVELHDAQLPFVAVPVRSEQCLLRRPHRCQRQTVLAAQYDQEFTGVEVLPRFLLHLVHALGQVFGLGLECPRGEDAVLARLAIEFFVIGPR